MLLHARLAQQFTGGRTTEQLRQDRMRTLAVQRALEIIGEAASRVSAPTQLEFQEIPWKNIIGMRNIIVHRYMYIDLDVIRHTTQDEVPVLIQHLRRYLNREPVQPQR